MYSDICAFCEQWDIAPGDLNTRAKALDKGEFHPCRKHSPATFQGKETCSYFDGVKP